MYTEILKDKKKKILKNCRILIQTDIAQELIQTENMIKKNIKPRDKGSVD